MIICLQVETTIFRELRGIIRLCILAALVSLASAFQAQERYAPLPPMEDSAQFDISTVKPSDPRSAGRDEEMPARQWSAINTSLIYLLERAYGIQSNQIIGAPAWAFTDKYDVTAKT